MMRFTINVTSIVGIAIVTTIAAACEDARSPGSVQNAGEVTPQTDVRTAAQVKAEKLPNAHQPTPLAQPSLEPCAAICSHALTHQCSAASLCATMCTQMQQVEVCPTEMRAVLTCMAREPSEHWQCSPEGTVVLKEGFCDAAQAAFARCAGMGS